MQVQIYRALWGMMGSLEENLAQIAGAGYDGVEAWIMDGEPSPEVLLPLVEKHNLKLIVATAIPEKADLYPTLNRLAAYNPVKINVQSGRDAMTFDEGCAYLEEALKVEASIGVQVNHETHRGKLLFTPWTTAAYLKKYPDIYITADYSHWVNVCERLPTDQLAALMLANARVRHIHGRVGYEEGPQVPDPSAPEYANQLAWHEQQWQSIFNAQKQRNADIFTFTPEYGPPDYLHTLPHTYEPVADLWQVCLWAANRARQLFK